MLWGVVDESSIDEEIVMVIVTMKKLVMLVLSFILVIASMCLTACTSYTIEAAKVENVPSGEEITSIPWELEAHFFRLSFGGGLTCFPYRFYENSGTIVLSGKDQLDELFSATYLQSYSDEAQSWVKDNRFTDIIKRYDDEFFKNHQVVTFFVTAAGGAYYFEHSRNSFENGVLTIELIHKADDGVVGHCALVQWFGIVEIERITGDAQIDIKVNSRGW